MAYNYDQSGDRIRVASTGSAIAVGDPVLIPGRGYGISMEAIAASGDSGEVKLSGVFELTADSSAAFAQGDKLYWNGTQLSNLPVSGSDYIGLAFAAKGASSTTGFVLLATSGPVGAGVVQLLPKDFRVHDANQTPLPATAANDDLAQIGGTFGTATPTIQAADPGGTSVTAYGRIQTQLPGDYVAGSPVTLRARAGVLTSVADASCTLDAEVYAADGDGGVSADLCATAAQSMNSLTFANLDFTVTPTALGPGDVLDIRLTVAAVDAGNTGTIIPEISEVKLLY